MSRRTSAAAEQAAQAASEAARTLAQRSHEARQESQQVESPSEAPKLEPTTSPDRVEKLLKARPHSQAMDDLRKRRGEVDEETEQPAEAPVEAKVEPKEEKPVEAAPPVEVVPEAPKTFKVKVDGEEFEVSAEEVESAGGVKAYQLSKANENRLAKTNAALEETRKVQAQMAEWLQSQAKASQKPEPTDAQYIAERIDKIRFGTPEESAQAMREVMDRGRPQVDQNVIVQRTTANLKYDLADQQFKQEFAEVLSNPLAAKLAKVLETERLAQYSPNGVANWAALSAVDWGNFKRTIGNEIRSAFGRQSQPPTTTDKKPADTTSPAADKEARKASIVNLPTAAARAELPKEEKELSPEEQRRADIAAMKKARGQA